MSYTIIQTFDQDSMGSYGRISLARQNSTDQLVIIKAIKEIYWKESELEALKSLDHPHILKFIDYYYQDQTHHLVTQYAEKGDLLDFLEFKPYLEESLAQKFVVCIAKTVQYIHQRGYAHCDLKLENIFLDKDLNIIIGDWGAAIKYGPRINHRLGTIYSAAPEILTGNGYIGPEVDMWALGVIIYYLLVGNLPFDDDDDIVTYDLIVNYQYEIPSHVSTSAQNLISKLLCPVSSRLDSTSILDHPWMENI